MAANTVTVLLIEDDAIDAEAVERAFRRARIANPIVHVTDGLEGLRVLRGEEGAATLNRPYVILLDLNMPRMNGIEFLDVLRADESLNDSVVFVLTTSDDDRDKVAAYEKQVAGYMLKSNAGHDFMQLTGMLDSYWRIVELPPPRQ